MDFVAFRERFERQIRNWSDGVATTHPERLIVEVHKRCGARPTEREVRLFTAAVVADLGAEQAPRAILAIYPKEGLGRYWQWLPEEAILQKLLPELLREPLIPRFLLALDMVGAAVSVADLLLQEAVASIAAHTDFSGAGGLRACAPALVSFRGALRERAESYAQAGFLNDVIAAAEHDDQEWRTWNQLKTLAVRRPAAGDGRRPDESNWVRTRQSECRCKLRERFPNAEVFTVTYGECDAIERV